MYLQPHRIGKDPGEHLIQTTSNETNTETQRREETWLIKDFSPALAGVAQWMELGPWTKGSRIWLPVRAHAGVGARSPVRGCVSGNHIWWFSPSLSPFLPPFSWESVSQSMGWATGVRDTWKWISRSWKQEICMFNKHPQWVWGTLQLELGPKNEMVFHPHCLSFSEHLLLIRSWGFLSKLTINTLVWCIAPPCPEARQPW